MRAAALSAAALLWLPIGANAHSPVKGIMPFYAGMVHPFVVPAHVLAMIALGLLAAQNVAKEEFATIAATVLVAMAIGVSLGSALGDPDTDGPLLAACATVALLVSRARPIRVLLVCGAAAVAGVLMGLGSGPDGLVGSTRWVFLAGACVGAVIGISSAYVIAERGERPWIKVAIRVVASWIAASAVIVLAVSWFGPRKGVTDRRSSSAGWNLPCVPSSAVCGLPEPSRPTGPSFAPAAA